MIPEHIRNIFRNGEQVIPEVIDEIREIISREYPAFLHMFNQRSIDSYNNNTIQGRKQTGATILKYFK